MALVLSVLQRSVMTFPDLRIPVSGDPESPTSVLIIGVLLERGNHMRVSYGWLKTLVDLPQDPKDLERERRALVLRLKL